jgi:hypothetical protein
MWPKKANQPTNQPTNQPINQPKNMPATIDQGMAEVVANEKASNPTIPHHVSKMYPSEFDELEQT